MEERAIKRESQSDSNKSNTAMVSDGQAIDLFGGVRLPSFWKNRPKLWFIQLEYQFLAYNISSDDVKLGIVLRHLDNETIFNIAKVLEQPPECNKYEHIKTVLIQKYSKFVDKQFTKLLGEIELGNKSPSMLLQEMRTMVESNVADDVLRKLWLQKLPECMQEVLIVVQDSITLDKLAEFADLVLEKTMLADVSTCRNDNDAIKTLTNEVHKLKHIVESTIRNNEANSSKNAETIKELKEQVELLKGQMERIVANREATSSSWQDWKIWAS